MGSVIAVSPDDTSAVKKGISAPIDNSSHSEVISERAISQINFTLYVCPNDCHISMKLIIYTLLIFELKFDLYLKKLLWLYIFLIIFPWC